LVAFLTIVAVLTFVPAHSETVKAPEIVEVPAGIARLLDDYGSALQRKDGDLFAGTLGGSLRETELKSFDNTRDVPFREFRVETVTQFSGNLAYGRVRSLYPGREVRTFHVTEVSALDVESTPYEEDGAFTFVRDRTAPDDAYDGWRLVSKSDLNILAFFSPYHLWDAGPVSVLRSEHFVLLTHPDVLDEMRPVIDVAERGYRKATSFWPRPVSEKYVILVPATTDELFDMLHTPIDLSKFVAFTSSGVDQSNGWEPTGPRLFVHLAHLRQYGEQGRLEIVAHELLHALTRPVTGPHIPVWVEEGLANAGGGNGGRPSQAGAGPTPDDFPPNESFMTGPVQQIIIRYDQAQAAIQVLIDRFGRDVLARFYERLGSERVVPGTDTYYVRRAISEALDWSQEDWVAAWRKSLG
jgi:hypothetical protein